MEKKSPKSRDYREMLALKGMGVELQKMEYPRISNLRNMLNTLGYEIVNLKDVEPKIDEENGTEFKYQ